jgi:hypothetical protein
MDEQLRFCREHRLPVNDVWLVSTEEAAKKVRMCLDRIASNAVPTAEAIAALDATVSSGLSDKVLRVHGTYPHDQWQGTRIEGFVVSQGPAINTQFAKNIGELAAALDGQRINIADFQPELVKPASRVLGHVPQATDLSADNLKAEVPQLADLMVCFLAATS